MLKPVQKTTDFVKKHRVAIAVTVTSLVWLKLQMSTAAEFNKFLADHDLLDEYYADPDLPDLVA